MTSLGNAAPPHTPDGSHCDADRLLVTGQQAQQRGDYQAAKRCYQAALNAAPDHPAALNALGMIALRLDEFGEARDLFARAAEADPSAAALLINLATAYRRLGDDYGERAALVRALERDQLSFIAQLRLAEHHERRGEDKDAAIRWSAVVQLASGAADRPPLVDQALAHGQHFLAAHGENLGRRVEEALGNKLQQLGRRARRFSACVDHTLRGRIIYGNECSGVHFPFLPAEEFFDRDHFPWLGSLEAQTSVIRREVERLLGTGSAAVRPYVRQDAGTPQNKWSDLDQNFAWSACFLWEYGVRNDPVCEVCPETAEALAAVPQNIIPGKAPTAFFSILKAGAHIPAHTGVTNTRAIVHLPLIVPDGCEFRVGGETRAWREGEAFVFDDTINHEAWNRSDQDRVVLIFDVWNPHLSEDERALLADFFTLVDQPAVA